MITKNFMALVALMLQSNGPNSVVGFLPAKRTNGNTIYLGPRFGNYSFPVSVSAEGALSVHALGIHVGSGNTPPTTDDYTLESPITSGLSFSAITKNFDADDNGNPFVELLFTVTNTSENTITIREISYVQGVSFSSAKGGNVNVNANSAFITLDRTVLDEPIIIPVSGSADIRYVLKTILPT